MAGEGAAPNKFLITQCSIRLITGAKLKIYYSLGNALRGDMSLWTNILSVIVKPLLNIFHPYVRVTSPSHRVGLVNWFPLPRRQGVCATKKRKKKSWGDGINIGPTGAS